jgi:hypothetical protein
MTEELNSKHPAHAEERSELLEDTACGIAGYGCDLGLRERGDVIAEIEVELDVSL